MAISSISYYLDLGGPQFIILYVGCSVVQSREVTQKVGGTTPKVGGARQKVGGARQKLHGARVPMAQGSDTICPECGLKDDGSPMIGKR